MYHFMIFMIRLTLRVRQEEEKRRERRERGEERRERHTHTPERAHKKIPKERYSLVCIDKANDTKP